MMKIGTLCYIQKNGKTLMLHRVKKEHDMHEGKWNGLGGKLKEGESPEECVIREVKEECGLSIQKPTLKGILTFPKFNGEDDWYVFVYVAKNPKGRLIDSNEGNLAWISNAQLMKLNLWAGDKIFLKWLTRRGFFSAKFSYRDGKLASYKVAFYR